MIVTPMNSNVVVVPMVQTGCMKAEFDSVYPINLNDFVSQEEFQQSISHINTAIGSNKCLIIIIIIFTVMFLGGLALAIAGPTSTINSSTTDFSKFGIFLGVGIGLIFLGMICPFVGCCIMQSRQMKQVRQAIAEESEKYSSRSSKPSSWRLNTIMVFTGAYRKGRPVRAMKHQLLIEIGENGAFPSHTTAPLSINDYPPPAYSGSSTGFCTQCGAPRQNFTGNFCASCGQAFNKY